MGAMLGCPMDQTSAPHLDEYFAKSKDFVTGPMATLMTEVGTMVVQVLMGDEEKWDQVKIKMKQVKDIADELKAPLRDIIRKSFDFHDSNQNGVLDEAESQLFFQHFVERFVPFTVNCTEEILDKTIAKQMTDIEEMCGGDKDAAQPIKDMITKRIAEVKAPLMASLKAKGDAYKTDKAMKDKAAFAVLDVSGDGKLQKEEVVEGLFLESTKHLDFMQALGLMTPEEVAQNRSSVEVRNKIISGEMTFTDFLKQTMGAGAAGA